MKTNEINPSDNNEIRDNSSKGLEIKTTSDDKLIDGKEPNKFEEVEKEKLSKDSEVETKWENNNEQFRHFENTSNQEPYNKTEEFREEANSYAEKLREDREEQKTKLNELREEQERLKKQLDEMAEERNLSASNYMNDKEFCKVLDDHTAVSEDIKETEMASKVTESNIERAEELGGKERREEEEAQEDNKGKLEVTEKSGGNNSEVEEKLKDKNKFEEVEKEKISKDSELETKWENNNEQFQHFENTSNQKPYNKTEEFREEANSYAEKLREDREEQKTKLNELREEQERLKKQLDEMAEERNLSASNYMNDKEFCKVLDDHTAVSEDIKETEMASKVTESNIERAEELGGKERREEEEAQEDNKGKLEVTEKSGGNNSEVEEKLKDKNKFEEVEKEKISKDSELETKWENNNEQFQHFENTSNQKPYNKTEEFREEANSYAEKLREDREEQKTKLNELREEQERLKKQLDEMAEERNLSASNYMNDKEFCKILEKHDAVSEEIKETQMALKLTESNVKRAEELGGKEIEEENKFDKVESGNSSLEELEKNKERELDVEKIREQDDKNEIRERKIKELIGKEYEKARKIAKKESIEENDGNQGLYARYFTEHGERHVEMVKEKALEVANAIRQGLRNRRIEMTLDENRITLSDKIDEKVLTAAALCHDVGMNGEGYKIVENSERNFVEAMDGAFNNIRKNHSLNSALYVLEQRDVFKEMGYTDNDVNKIAMLCFTHSKSNSGVRNLESQQDWNDGIEKLKAVAKKYEADNPGTNLEFDKYNPDKDELGELASSALALRIGDVSRDSGENAKSQSGEEVRVKRETVGEYFHNVIGENENGYITEKETESRNAKVTLRNESGEVDMYNEISKGIHIGEQNIIGNRTYCEDKLYLFTHEIEINDADYAPESTISAIKEHLGELQTVPDEKFKVKIKCNRKCNQEVKELYKEFAFLYSDNKDIGCKNIKVEIEFGED